MFLKGAADGLFKPTSYHHDPVVVKCKTMGDIFEIVLCQTSFHSLDTYFVFLLLVCFWKGLLCEVAMDNNSDIYQMQHKGVGSNNPAIRGELINS